MRFWSVVLFALLLMAPRATAYHHPPAQVDEPDAAPLVALMANIPLLPVFPDMEPHLINYVNYRAVEQANGIAPIADRAAYRALTDKERAAWQTSLLRVRAGLDGMVNLTHERINAMPELLGFDYFDMDSSLWYGNEPFIGVLVRSEDGRFLATRTASALATRGFERRVVATGTAWGKGGDGMTDLANIELGDPFGGDVGLSSRVAVFDPYTVMNSFLWPLVFTSAEAHAGIQPNYTDFDIFPHTAQQLAQDGDLLQALIVNRTVGERYAADPDALTLPPYDLAAVADLQRDEQQVQRVLLVYAEEAAAERALDLLPGFISEFDGGWLDRLGFGVGQLTVVAADDRYTVVFDLVADAPTPADVQDGGYEPGLIFGFWVTAIRQGNFTPIALPTPTD